MSFRKQELLFLWSLGPACGCVLVHQPGSSPNPVSVGFCVFIYLAASGLSCGMWDLSCGMWDLLLHCAGSSLWCAGFSLVVVSGLSSCSAWAPEHAGSVVAAHGLSSCGA